MKYYPSMAKYYVVAFDKNSCIGTIGYFDFLDKAIEIGRKFVEENLPNGEGSYTIRLFGTNQKVHRGERSSSTNFEWILF